jgi:tetratricopeptide (TPR) repeat protein
MFTTIADARQPVWLCLVVLSLTLVSTSRAQDISNSPPDLVLWRAIKESNNPALFTDLITKFPSSSLAALARVRADELLDRQTMRAIGTELPFVTNMPLKSFSTGVEVPTVAEIRERAVAVAIRAAKIMSAPNLSSNPIADVQDEQVLSVHGKKQNDWIEVMAPGGRLGYFPVDSVRRSTPEESFFAEIKNPVTTVAAPLAPWSGNPRQCLDQPSHACILSLIEAQLSGLQDAKHQKFIDLVSAVLLHLGHLDAARRYLDEALENARQAKPTEYVNANFNRALSLLSLAGTLAEFGEPRWALETYAEAIFYSRLSHAKGRFLTDAGERSKALSFVARGLGSHGFRKQATSLFAEAVQSARMMPNDTNLNIDHRVDRLIEIAEFQVNIGDINGALTTFAIAFSDAAGTTYLMPNGDEDPWRGQLLQKLAADIARIGYFDLAIHVAHAIGDPDARQEALASIAELLAPLDRHAASELVDEVMKFDKAQTWAAVGLVGGNYIEPGIWVFNRVRFILDQKFDKRTFSEALAKAGAFDQATKIASTIQDKEYYEKAMCEIAEQLVRAGRDADKDKLVKAMRDGTPTVCAEEIDRAKRRSTNDKITMALKTHSWDAVSRLIQGTSPYDDDAFDSVRKMAYDHPEAAAFTALYRSLPSGHAEARSYALIGILLSI